MPAAFLEDTMESEFLTRKAHLLLGCSRCLFHAPRQHDYRRPIHCHKMRPRIIILHQLALPLAEQYPQQQ